MNILFYTSYKVSSTKGGTERTTITVASGLKKFYGYRCYSLYSVADETPKEDCFVDEMQWRVEQGCSKLRTFIIEKKIDCIINQGVFGLTRVFKNIVEDINCRVVFAHHFQPGWELYSASWPAFLRKEVTLGNQSRFKLIFKYPYYRIRLLCRIPANYRNTYVSADKVVLLCNSYIQDYVRIGHLNDKQKFVVIPNALSFDDYLSINDLSQKKNITIIVSRLEENPKRISLALKIWKELKNKYPQNDWKLHIIGYGCDENLYREIVATEKITDVFFLGRKPPKSYYKKSSILLMTSKSEGWGLTLTEAQQFGVVPMAFDSFDSLRDIISDGEDGILVPDSDVDKYVVELRKLMDDKRRRETLAKNAIKNCQRFKKTEVVSQWYEMLESINNK